MERAEIEARRALAAQASPPASVAGAVALAVPRAAEPTVLRGPRVTVTRARVVMGTRTHRRVTKGPRVRPAGLPLAVRPDSDPRARGTVPRVTGRSGRLLRGPAAVPGRTV